MAVVVVLEAQALEVRHYLEELVAMRLLLERSLVAVEVQVRRLTLTLLMAAQDK